MKTKISTAIYLLCVIVLSGCISRNNVTHLVPGDEYYNSKPEKIIAVDSITETKNGAGNANLPQWMHAYISGGIAELERIDLYRDRYLFIGRSEGANFTALNKWAGNYSVVKDFPRLAAARIEYRLVSAALLYPDDEYGSFFEMLIKKAFDSEYPGAIKEETFWIKTEQINEDIYSQNYEFFVFISIDKAAMQNVIRKMMAEVTADVTPTRSQGASINRLQQIFFEGF